MAKSHVQTRYTQCDWGDLIEGTKEQLQSFGLGIGLAFPGEFGGPRRDLNVRDSRGFAVRISNQYCKEDEYTAYIKFPDLPKCPSGQSEWVTFAPGVKTRESYWTDEFVGTAEALVAARLACAEHFPGKPGMPKCSVRLFPDGSLPGSVRGSSAELKAPGAKQIERASSTTFCVSLYVASAEGERRRSASRAADLAWSRAVRALPRPARLKPTAAAVVQKFDAALFDAARDIRFQGALARIVSAAGRSPSA